MLSSSHLKPSAPSATLLRFLRSQSDFLSVNSSRCARPSRSKPYVHQILPCNASSRASSTWTCTASAPHRTTLQTSLVRTLPPRQEVIAVRGLDSGSVPAKRDAHLQFSPYQTHRTRDPLPPRAVHSCADSSI